MYKRDLYLKLGELEENVASSASNHRSMVSADRSAGTSCFSQPPRQLQRSATSFFEASVKRMRANSSTETAGRPLQRQNSQIGLRTAVDTVIGGGRRRLSQTLVSAAFRRKLEWFENQDQVHRKAFLTDEQIVHQRWLLLPTSCRKIVWDWLVIGVVLWNLFEIPLVLGFRIERPPLLDAVNVLVDVLLVVDVRFLLPFAECHRVPSACRLLTRCHFLPLAAGATLLPHMPPHA